MLAFEARRPGNNKHFPHITKGEQLPIIKAIMEKLLVFLTLPQEKFSSEMKSADWSHRLELEDRGAGLMKFFHIFKM